MAIASWAQTRGFPRSQVVSVEDLTCDGSEKPLGVGDSPLRFHWVLTARAPNARGIEQSAFEILIASSRGLLDLDSGDIWDSGKTDGALTPAVLYGGAPLESDTAYYWKVRVWTQHGEVSQWSEPSRFLTGLLNRSDWLAKWIAATPDGPTPPQARGNDDSRLDSDPRLPIFRDTFNVPKPVKRATLFLSGLGEAAALVNAMPVTSAVLTPGWTNYRKTVLYDTYDVTALLHRGDNAIGIMLGNGMYRVPGVEHRYTKFVGSFGQPKVIAELRIHYTDGTVDKVITNDHWRTTPGPIVFSSIYGGEDYDARRAQAGWSLPDFRDDRWMTVHIVDGPGGMLRAERLPPVQPEDAVAPMRITHVAPDDTIYDLGRNFAGRPVISVSGTAGSRLRILTGELLDRSGHVNQASEGASPDAPIAFDYILGGTGTEHWRPQFTYSGFRYAEVSMSGALSRFPAVLEFAGEPLHDAAHVDGSFSSSSDLLNRIHKLIDTAIQNNMVSVLTDCPTREKLGWLEQTYLAGPSILYNYNLSLLYRKMALDMRDSQLPNGMVPSIAPEVVAFVDDAGDNTDFRDSPEWGSAIILSPWTAYTFYGDVQLLRDNYDAMVAYANYLQTQSKDNMVGYGLGDWYDIGSGEPGKSQLTGPWMTATAIYYQDLKTLARIAAILDKTSDATDFSQRASLVAASLNGHLFHSESNNYDRGSQTANAMALALGVVPEDHRKSVLDNLVADIRRHGNHVTAGDIGFHYLVRALTDNQRSDVLYDLLMRMDSPSYGYQLKRGATALTEAWDSNPASSQDHFMLGHAEEWFYRGLGGIDFDLDRERDKRIWIHPQIVGDVQSASADYLSVLGAIRSHWQRDEAALRLEVAIPPGTTATITFPPAYRRVRESGSHLKGDNGVLSTDEAPEGLSCVVGSGNYHFSAQR